MRIYKAEKVTDKLVADVAGLVPQLSPRAEKPSFERLKRVVESDHAVLFVAEMGGPTVGMLTLGWYDTPTGRRAWIEDVVVDVAVRGGGVGRALVRAALVEARRLEAASLQLTSAPARAAARRLYAEEGFEIVETNVFRLK